MTIQWMPAWSGWGHAWGAPTKELPKDSSTAPAKVDEPNTIDGVRPDNKTLRYPNDTYLGVNTDYVFFQFGKYNPPFGKQYKKEDGIFQDGINKKADGSLTTEKPKYTDKDEFAPSIYNLYNDSTDLEIKGPSIILPMPQDLGNEIAQTWQGKQFSGIGRAAVAALAGANMSFTNAKFTKASNNWKSFQTALNKSILNNMPGAGGAMTMNDISGSTRGIVMNPNTELLYDSPELREIGMTWKLVPKNDKEAAAIKTIIDAFRDASLPSFGSSDNPVVGNWANIENQGSMGNSGTDSSTKVFSEENFIHVPWLCKFTFMKGNETHRHVAQFKPCAISKVRVSYTPDGMYSTYADGSPVATELSLNFIESKLIFKGEVTKGY